MLSILISLISFIQVSSIYNLHITTAGGQDLPLSAFQGKRMLLVNIASSSPRTSQLAELRQLKQQFGDSLVVILFPSNSFNNEPKSNAEIKAFIESNYGTGFVIAQKATVKDVGIQPVFYWLTHASENGVADANVSADFHKFLIDRTGNISGAFAPVLSPANSILIRAINNAE